MLFRIIDRRRALNACLWYISEMKTIFALLLAWNAVRNPFVTSLAPLLILKILKRNVQDTVAHPGNSRTRNFFNRGLVHCRLYWLALDGDVGSYYWTFGYYVVFLKMTLRFQMSHPNSAFRFYLELPATRRVFVERLLVGVGLLGWCCCERVALKLLRERDATHDHLSLTINHDVFLNV